MKLILLFIYMCTNFIKNLISLYIYIYIFISFVNEKNLQRVSSPTSWGWIFTKHQYFFIVKLELYKNWFIINPKRIYLHPIGYLNPCELTVKIFLSLTRLMMKVKPSKLYFLTNHSHMWFLFIFIKQGTTSLISS